MPTVAEQLRTAREAQSLTIPQLAEITKIRSDHLRALEEGNYDAFVAPVYIRGFVRTYAGLLKLEVPAVMATLDAELHATEKFSEPPPLSGEPRGVLDYLMLQLSRLDWRKTALVGGAGVAVAIIVSVVAVVRHVQRSDPLAGITPAVYDPGRGSASAVSGELLPLTNAPAPGRR